MKTLVLATNNSCCRRHTRITECHSHHSFPFRQKNNACGYARDTYHKPKK
jgi:hypothetical protein